ncbi:MAG: hypothetical protein IKA63_06115 [Clostridia bacterium]|nr:hypothetical protein [Clostridia bacterium]
MKIEPLKSGCFKIWMTENDMQRWGLRFDDMSADHRATRTAVMRLLAIVKQRTDLHADGMTVEAVPVEGGCLLLFTPHGRRPLFRMPQPQIYALHTADDLLQLGEGLSADDALPAASLYSWGDEYRLILYAGVGGTRGSHLPLAECAEKVGEGTASAAFIEEHGQPITVGNALHRLCAARGSHPPVPPRPER